MHDTTTWTIDYVFKELDVSFVDDTTYKKLENMGSQYEYIDNDLLEQMIEAELIIMLERDNWCIFIKINKNGSSSFSMDKMIFNSRPRWFLWGHPHKTTKIHKYKLSDLYCYSESVVKVHWILQMGEMNPNKIDV